MIRCQIAALAFVAISLTSVASAFSNGAVKGAVVGATAGKFVGNGHVNAGAAAGAVVGHHHAAKPPRNS